MQALQKAKDAFHEEQKAAAPYLARAHRSILDGKRRFLLHTVSLALSIVYVCLQQHCFV